MFDDDALKSFQSWTSKQFAVVWIVYYIINGILNSLVFFFDSFFRFAFLLILHFSARLVAQTVVSRVSEHRENAAKIHRSNLRLLAWSHFEVITQSKVMFGEYALCVRNARARTRSNIAKHFTRFHCYNLFFQCSFYGVSNAWKRTVKMVSKRKKKRIAEFDLFHLKYVRSF